MSRVGVVHAPGAAAALRDIVLAARAVGADPVFVLRASTAETYPRLAGLAEALAELAVVPDDGAAQAIATLGLAGLTTFHDAELELCDAVLTALGLPGAPALADPWDKLVQRERFAAAGLGNVPATAVNAPDDLGPAVDRIGLPAVLKPRRSAASVGLAFLRTTGDVAREVATRAEWDRLVLERFIPHAGHPAGTPYLADYISVESLSVGAEHLHYAVFDKFPLSIADASSPPRFAVRETGDVLPSQLSADRIAAIREQTSRVLDALSIRDRMSHTEFRVTADGVVPIEVNGRLGGEVARPVRLLGGDDPLRAALELALGGKPFVAPPSEPGYVATLYVPFPHRGGTVRSTVSRTAVRALPAVGAVDEVAVHGADRADTGFHATKLLLRAADPATLGQVIGGAVERIAEWFADDGLQDDEWLRTLRSRTTTATGRAPLRDALHPGDMGYRDACRVWNGMIERRPAVIARCRDATDVAAALRHAAAERLPVTVRGGGHNVAGLSVADGALLIDLSPMRSVEVDPAGRRAVAGGGALLGDVDAATAPHSLALPTGLVGDTGLGGLALGGGYGWLSRRWGLTCDHIEWAEVVLADGSIVRADPEQNPELLWGLRGGGGNFGVVTTFGLRLRPVGDVWHHSAVYAPADVAGALRAYRALAPTQGEDLHIVGTLKRAAAADWLPAGLTGEPVVGLTGVWFGDPEQGRAVFADILDAVPPAGETGRRLSHAQLQALGDGIEPRGRRYYTKSCYLTGLPEPVIDILAAAGAANPSPYSTIDLGYLLGAIAAIPGDTAAFPRRDAPFICSASAAWERSAADEQCRIWSRSLIEALGPWHHGGSYVNYTQPDPESARQVYGEERYERLSRLKAAVDPGNVFRTNHNISPAV